VPDAVATLVAEVREVVDVTDAQALTALNRRHRRMVAHARSFRKRVEIGPTVAGQARYAVSGVVEVFGVTVDGAVYGRTRRDDLFDTNLTWTGPAGLVVLDASSAGVESLSLIPEPSDAGLSIELYAAVLPDDMVLGDAASAIKVDSDFYDVLVEAAAATYLRRQGEGDPETSEARFDAECERLRNRVQRRLKGGVTQVRLAGFNV
jgi:hypothetical protein